LSVWRQGAPSISRDKIGRHLGKYQSKRPPQRTQRPPHLMGRCAQGRGGARQRQPQLRRLALRRHAHVPRGRRHPDGAQPTWFTTGGWLSRGGCPNRWHSLVNSTHGDAMTRRRDSRCDPSPSAPPPPPPRSTTCTTSGTEARLCTRSVVRHCTSTCGGRGVIAGGRLTEIYLGKTSAPVKKE
jgi:hypothetical protein